MQNRHRRAAGLVAATAAITLILAACGGGASPGSTASAAPATTAASPSPAASAGAVAPEVGIATSATAGAYLTGKGGLALYVFKKDTGSTSTCYDACAAAWPPFLAEGGAPPAAAPGIGGTFGTTARTDGSLQVTYNGAPIYYFAGDAAPGDTNGQGLSGVWFLAAP